MRHPQELNEAVRQVVGERQEYGGGKDLPGLHALQREAGVITAPPERRVLQDHRAGAGDFSGDRKALNEAQSTSSIGARMPTCSYVGNTPTAMVENPMRNMQTSSTVLRPCVSPQWPRKKAPIGRAT